MLANHAAVLASYEKNFPLKDLAPVFAEIEAAEKEAEKARDEAKKLKKVAEKNGEKTAQTADVKMEGETADEETEEKMPKPGACQLGSCSGLMIWLEKAHGA